MRPAGQPNMRPQTAAQALHAPCILKQSDIACMSCSLQRSKAKVKAKGLAWTKWVLGQSLPHRPQDFLLGRSLIAELPRQNSILQAASFTVKHNAIVAADH